MKILLVDDDPWARKLYTMLLRDSGHEVLASGDAEEAWTWIQQGEISLVVSDWLMPGLSGLDLCRRIRAAAFDHYVYVILCTAKGKKADLIEGMDAGADDFVVKPVSREELRVAIRAGERILQLESGLAQRNRELAETNEYLERAYTMVTNANRQLSEAYALIEEDLKAASWVQRNMLPAPVLNTGGVEFRWYFKPSRYVAGDSLNFFELAPGILGFYSLDVSGHGVPAAMLSVTLSMVLTPDSTHGSPLKKFNAVTGQFEPVYPSDVIHEVNRRFQGNDDRYFTMIYGTLDTRRQVLTFAQAGHPSPVLIPANGTPAYFGGTGMPVGMLPEIEFDCVETPFRPGDRLILYSDGVTECINREGVAFGSERFLETVTPRAGEALEATLQSIATALDSWKEGLEFRDDISVVAIEFTAQSGKDANHVVA